MKKLRSGYTTGACAAAAAKGAALHLLTGSQRGAVDIPFPDGSRVRFVLIAQDKRGSDLEKVGYAAVIKDAGDDPDVTNGAEICAAVRILDAPLSSMVDGISICGGEGVGTITKRGLALPIGAPAINPVPLEMIRAAVSEVLSRYGTTPLPMVEVEISIPKGKELADKTLNERLGIIGGLSILGTTGIVRPISAKAWTATITSSMDVAAANSNTEIVLSTGRTSEAALEKTGKFKTEALIMMGDYLEFALKEAAKYPFTRLHLAGMWAKILKAALETPQTHVRFGALESEQAASCIASLYPEKDLGYLSGANTAREIYERLIEHGDRKAVTLVCKAAQKYHRQISGLPVTVYLVHHSGTIAEVIK